MLGERLFAKNELFYSHSILEHIMEETDSIRPGNEEYSLLFYKNGEVRRTLSLDRSGLRVSFLELEDTLFISNMGWELHVRDEEKRVIDSIYIKSLVDNDTLTLKYGLTNNSYLLNNQTRHADLY